MGDRCPHCGAKLPATGDAFCSECHQELDEPPAQPRSPSRHAEGPVVSFGPATLVWYASEDRLFRWLKLSWYDDRGSLDATEDGLRFLGETGTIRMPRGCTVQPPRLILHWLSVASLAVGNGLLLFFCAAGGFASLTLGNLLTYAGLAFLNVLTVALWPLWWVRVDYRDDEGRSRRAYFTPGSVAARLSGGVRRLHERMRQDVAGPE